MAWLSLHGVRLASASGFSSTTVTTLPAGELGPGGDEASSEFDVVGELLLLPFLAIPSPAAALIDIIVLFMELASSIPGFNGDPTILPFTFEVCVFLGVTNLIGVESGSGMYFVFLLFAP